MAEKLPRFANRPIIGGTGTSQLQQFAPFEVFALFGTISDQKSRDNFLTQATASAPFCVGFHRFPRGILSCLGGSRKSECLLVCPTFPVLLLVVANYTGMKSLVSYRIRK